jgi:hypothetical protein
MLQPRATDDAERRFSQRGEGTDFRLAANSRGFLVVVTQEPTQPLATLHRPLATHFRDPEKQRKQQDVGLPLMIPLGMVMSNILAQRTPQRALTKEK